jgi:hypothetical protein
MMPEEVRKRIKIPLTATLEDVITIMNYVQYEANINDSNPDFQKWIYEHKDWIVDDDE